MRRGKKVQLFYLFVLLPAIVFLYFKVFSFWKSETSDDNTRYHAVYRKPQTDKPLEVEVDVGDVNSMQSEPKHNNAEPFIKTLEPVKFKVIRPQEITRGDVPALKSSTWQGAVLYVWCDVNKRFTYENYLSVRSVLTKVQPSTLTFAYVKRRSHVLQPDSNDTYNTWLDELQRDFPFWSNVAVEPRDPLCHLSYPTKTSIEEFVGKMRTLYGALYVGSRTLITRALNIKRTDAAIDVFDRTNGEGFYYVPANLERRRRRGMQEIPRNITCYRSTHQGEKIPDACAVLSPQEFFPQDIMFGMSPMAALLRSLTYGSSDFANPTVNYETLAPLEAHYVWLGGGEVNLGFYLSLLSALYVAELDTVYIHADLPPKGDYWKKITANQRGDRVILLLQQKPKIVYNQNITVIEHMADVIKSSVMHQYGGIMMDPDVLFLQKIPNELRGYEAVVSPDIADRAPWPDILNMGISISKPGSRFAKKWLESERNFRDKEWLWNCGYMTYRSWEREPSIAYLNRHLQIICYQHSCYPLWGDRENYKDLSHSGDSMASGRNWREAAISMHVTWPDPFVYLDNIVHVDTGMFGQVARMVLRKAGVIGKDFGMVP